MTTFARKSFELPPEDRFRLRACVDRDLRRFAPRLDHPVDVDELVQPFFPNLQLLEVVSAVPPPPQKVHIGRSVSPRRIWVLTEHIESLNEMARYDRPRDLTDPRVAKDYALHGSGWTTESALGELRVDSLDEIPWSEKLSAEETARVADLERTLGAQVGPERLEMSIGEYHLTYWLVSNRRLVRRTLTVTIGGELRRQDQVVAEQLPLPAGRYWGLVDGRFVPVG